MFENLLVDGSGKGGIYWDNMGEKTAAGQLLVRNATITGTKQAGLQIEGLAADHIQIQLEHVRIVNTATDYTGPCEDVPMPAKCNGSASLSPIVLGDPEHGNIVEDFFVGTIAFGPGCVVEGKYMYTSSPQYDLRGNLGERILVLTDTMDRHFLSFVAGNGSLGVAGLTGLLTVKNQHPQGCTALLGPGQKLEKWGLGDAGLDLSLEVDCQSV